MGDSYTDETLPVFGIPNWVETLVAADRIDAGPFASFPNGDPRHGVFGQSYTYNFALGRWLFDPVQSILLGLKPEELFSDITSNYSDGLAYATNNGNHPVQMVFSNYPDLGTMPMSSFLTQTQKDNLRPWIDALNVFIDLTAAQYNAPVVDLHSWWEDVRSAGGTTIYGNFVPASEWFVVDGLHPTAIAQAAWAERIVDAMNTRGAGLEPLSEKEMVHYSGLDPNDAPVAHAGGTYSILTGEGLTLNASASSDADPLDTLTYRWDINGDGNYNDATTVSPTLSWSQLQTLGIAAGNSYNVRVEVSDGFAVNGQTVSSATTLTVLEPAIPNIGGPYSGDEGSAIPLSASASVGASLYEWDLDNDGQYDDAVGENVNFNATDNGVFTIGLRINGVGGPTDSTTVSVNNLASTASIAGTAAIYRGEEVTFTLSASDASSVDQAGLFNFEIDWDGNGTVDETLLGVPSGTTVQHAFPSLTSNNIQVRATDKDGSTGGFSQLPITVTPHVLRDDGFGNTDLIYGGAPGFDAVFVLGQAPGMSIYFQVENAIATNRLEYFGSAITGRVILHGYGFTDILAGELGPGNVMEIYGGDGDDIIVGGSLGDFLYGGNGNDILIGGTRATDGDDYLSGGEGRDSLYGYLGADTLDGGGGEDLLVSDHFLFSDQHSAIQSIHEEWKSARPYSERVSNIQGITSTGVNGPWTLQPGVTIVDDGAEDTLIGGIGDLDWFFYDFSQDLLGDTIELDEEETDTNP
ncbi:unnamed protein product [Cladocopium goreaui]|uniref:Hemolysin, chromosomal n=1 Tax=Cladocopium goreaui TaxID=2562237 RepID=A0A9P1FCC2_9DINO|nr:unnamed protein product [Cladocopium goreaui]